LYEAGECLFEAKNGILTAADGIVKELISGDFFTMNDSLLTSVGNDHVVDALVGIASDARLCRDDFKVISESSGPSASGVIWQRVLARQFFQQLLTSQTHRQASIAQGMCGTIRRKTQATQSVSGGFECSVAVRWCGEIKMEAERRRSIKKIDAAPLFNGFKEKLSSCRKKEGRINCGDSERFSG
jgi:hypothetical protein